VVFVRQYYIIPRLQEKLQQRQLRVSGVMMSFVQILDLEAVSESQNHCDLYVARPRPRPAFGFMYFQFQIRPGISVI